MFTLDICRAQSCEKLALSTFDENGTIVAGNYCFEHSPNADKSKNDIYRYIETHDTIIGLNAAGIAFNGIDLSGKRFYGCNFHDCEFVGIHSKHIRSRVSVFDFSRFIDCSLLESNMLFVSFAGATFSRTLFTGSDLVQDNFNGIEAFQSSFDDSDLYNSRFIRARLRDTSFRNCNIKKTVFIECARKNVSFKLSNTREAIFTREGSALAQEMERTGGAIL